MLFGASIVLLASIHVGGWAEEKYMPKEDEELYGTWTNEQGVKDYYHPPKSVVNTDGYKNFVNVSDSVPFEEGTRQIDSKWIDSEGDIWYKTFGTVTTGVYKGYKYQALVKISKSRTVSEFVFRSIGFLEFDPNDYPTKIDPNDPTYTIQYRAKE